jgi:hypothetical protein
MLENSLQRKFERELDQIPLPEPELWFPAAGERAGGVPRLVIAAIVTAAFVSAVVLASQRLIVQPKSDVATQPQGEVVGPSAKYPIQIPRSLNPAGPGALDACQLIAHAAYELGFPSSLPMYPVFRTVPEGIVFEHAEGPWFSHPCAFGYDGGWADPHLIVRPAATTSAEAERIFFETFAGEVIPPPTWTTDSPGIWIAHGPASPRSGAWVAVAVSADPYFLVVTGLDEDTARRLMQGVLDQIGTP